MDSLSIISMAAGRIPVRTMADTALLAVATSG